MKKHKYENFIAACVLAAVLFLFCSFVFASAKHILLGFAFVSVLVAAIIFCIAGGRYKQLSILSCLVLCSFVLMITTRGATAWSGTSISVVDELLTYSWTGSMTNNYGDSLSENKSESASVVHSETTTTLDEDTGIVTEGSFIITLSASTSMYYSTSSTNDCGQTETTHYRPGTTTVKATVSNLDSSRPMKIKTIEVLETNTSAVIGIEEGAMLLANGGSFDLQVTATPTSSTDTTSRTATLKVRIEFEYLDNVSLFLDASEYSDYSFTNNYDNADHEVLSNSGVAEYVFPVGTVITPAISVPDNYTFYGWRLSNGSLLDAGSTFTLDSDITLYPVLLTEEQIAAGKVFQVGATASSDGSNQFWFYEDAAKYAISASDKTIIPLKDYTLLADAHLAGITINGGGYVTGTSNNLNYIVPSGVTLLIPCDDANTVYTTQPGDDGNSTFVATSVYRKLTMSTGTNITVASGGAISIGGKVGTYMADTEHPDLPTYVNGAPSGPLGYIDMETGSSITVANGGNLYAWGFITGSGSVTVKSGGNVYEDLQIRDYRGGNAFSSMIENSNKVFPFTQYYIQNIEVPLTLESGAAESVCMAVSVSYVGSQKANAVYIGNESAGGLIRLSSGSMTRTYDGSKDRIIYDLNGSVSFANLNVTIKVALLGEITIDSEDYVMPINSNMTLNINDGSNVTLNQDIALLPGAVVNVAETAVCTLGSGNRLFVYDAAEWPTGYVGLTGAKFNAVYFAPGRTYTRTAADLVDAEVLLNGTLDATNGYIYTTSGGANIHSTGNGKLIVGALDETTVTYQATQSGSDVSYAGITVTPAKLQNEYTNNNELSTYTESGTVGTYYYHSTHKRWVLGGHSITNTVTAPTCTEKGYTTHTCACGSSYTDSEVAATGHTEVTDAAVAATCTTAGKTQGSHCSVCNTVIVEQTTVAALGHTEVTDAAVAATCTATGLTEGKHCSVCGTITVAQTTVAATGHTAGEAKKENETSTSYDSVVYCSVCGAEISRETIQTVVYSVTISWSQDKTATYTPGTTTYTWSPADLKYTASTTQGSWNNTQTVMTITIDNSQSTGAVTASFAYTETVAATRVWEGLTDNALTVAAEGSGEATLTLTPSGTPAAPTDGTNTVILGVITITLTKGG